MLLSPACERQTTDTVQSDAVVVRAVSDLLWPATRKSNPGTPLNFGHLQLDCLSWRSGAPANALVVV